MAESADITARDARTAAKLQPDADLEQIGATYAKALLGAARKDGQTLPILEELASLVADVLVPLPKLAALLASPMVPYEDKSAMLDKALRGRASSLLLNFLKVLSRHRRLDCLAAVDRQAKKLYEQSLERTRVGLTTARPIDSAMVRHIIESLRPAVGDNPIIEQSVDPDLIGGIMVRIGDTVYDGSIANQLQIVRQQVIDRSVHEIQSRRDRFSSPTGN